MDHFNRSISGILSFQMLIKQFIGVIYILKVSSHIADVVNSERNMMLGSALGSNGQNQLSCNIGMNCLSVMQFTLCHQLTRAAEESLQTQKASSSLLTGLITMLTIGSAFISSECHVVNKWHLTSPTWTWRLIVAVFLIMLRYDLCN